MQPVTVRKWKSVIGETMYKMVQIWPGLFVCKQAGYIPGHIWTTLYITRSPDD